MKTFIEAIPDWSLCYLFKGDKTGISEEERTKIDAWRMRNGIQYIAPPTDKDHPFYYDRPPYGLPCMCYALECSYIGY